MSLSTGISKKGKTKLVVLAGPTAVGKTDLAIRLASQWGTEIISADSRQFYHEMNIGSAKPDPEQLSRVPHHMIGHLHVDQPYNIFRYETDALALLGSRLPQLGTMFLVGGSGLYIDALCRGVDAIPDPDPALRPDLLRKKEELGLPALVDWLRRLDPVYCREADLKNPARVIRALEVCLQTGRPFSEFRTGKTAVRDFDILYIGLHRERDELFSRIDQRVDQMLRKGLLEECRALLPYAHYPALKTLGYKELFEYLSGQTSLSQAVAGIRTNTRRYARKQLTWFRRNPFMKWFNAQDLTGMADFIRTSSAR